MKRIKNMAASLFVCLMATCYLLATACSPLPLSSRTSYNLGFQIGYLISQANKDLSLAKQLQKPSAHAKCTSALKILHWENEKVDKGQSIDEDMVNRATHLIAEAERELIAR